MYKVGFGLIIVFLSFFLSGCADNFHTYDPAWDEPGDTVSVFVAPPTSITIVNRLVYLQNSKFNLRGFIYDPVPIGYYPNEVPYLETSDILHRDIDRMKLIGVTAMRVPQKLTTTNLLDIAYSAHSLPIYVILDFPIDTDMNLGSSTVRDNIRWELVDYVKRFKNHNAVLGWCIGNNINRDYKGNKKDWYTLLALLAKTVRDVDDSSMGHLILTANYGIDEIGDKSLSADDVSLPYLSCWGINISDGRWPSGQASSAFHKTDKAILVTEYGVDSFLTTTEGGGVDEEKQALWLGQYALSIEACEYITSGGFVNSYVDGWWQGGDPYSHDYKPGYTSPSQPDNFANIEYWGVCYCQVDTTRTDWVNIVNPRRSWFALEAVWTGHGHK